MFNSTIWPRLIIPEVVIYLSFIFFKNWVNNTLRDSDAALAFLIVFSWDSLSSPIPAPIFVIIDIAATFNPKNLDKITSGTVDIPTTCPPNSLAALISEGVSKFGPLNHV